MVKAAWLLGFCALSSCLTSEEHFCSSPDGINLYGSVQTCQLAMQYPDDWECRTQAILVSYDSVEACKKEMLQENDEWNCESKEDLALYGSRYHCSKAMEEPHYDRCYYKFSQYKSVEECKWAVDHPEAEACQDPYFRAQFDSLQQCVWAQEHPHAASCSEINEDHEAYMFCLTTNLEKAQQESFVDVSEPLNNEDWLHDTGGSASGSDNGDFSEKNKRQGISEESSGFEEFKPLEDKAYSEGFVDDLFAH